MFKRLTLLLALAVAATVSILAVTNLWTGSQYLEGNTIDISNDNNKLSALKSGDKVQVSFTNTEEGEIKITIQTEQGEKTLFEDFHVAANAGSVTFDVTDDFVAGIKKDNKFKIMAKKLTITSIDAITGEGGDKPNPDQPVDDGNYSLELPIAETTISSWYDIAAHKSENGNVFVYVKPGHMPGVKTGDEIRVTFVNNGGGQANFVFKGTDGNWVKVGENGQTNPDWINNVESNKEYIFPVKEGWAEALAANGLYIDGQNITVKKVVFYAKDRAEKPEIDDSGEVVTPGGDTPKPDDPKGDYILIWDGDEGVGDWNNSITVPASAMKHFTSVSEIKFEGYNDNWGDSHQYQVGLGNDKGLLSGDYHDFYSPVTLDVAAKSDLVIKNGFYIGGKSIKVTKIYIKGETDGGEIPVGPFEEEEVLAPNVTPETTVLWETGMNNAFEGSERVFGSEWKSANADDLANCGMFHIPASYFANTNLDDKIVVTFKNYNNAKASFHALDTEGTWYKRGNGNATVVNEDFDVTKAKNTRLVVNYRFAGAIRHNGLWIDAINCEIEKVELINYTNTDIDEDETNDIYPRYAGDPKHEEGYDGDGRGYMVIQNNADYPSVVDETPRRIRPRAFTNYNNGERIVFIFEKTGDNPQLRLNFIRPNSVTMRVAQGLTGTDDGIKTTFTELENGKIAAVYRPSQREIRALKANGLFLDGKDLNFLEVEFGNQAVADRTQDIWLHNDWITLGHDSGKTYEGDNYYSDQVEIYVSHTHFKRATESDWLGTVNEEYKGYYLDFFFSYVGPGARMKLTWDSNRTHDINMDPLNKFYNSAFDINDGPNKVAGNNDEDESAQAEGDTDAAGDGTSGTYYEGSDFDADKHVYVHLTDAQVRKLIDNGFWLTGGNADFQNVKLRSPMSVSGVEEVAEEMAEPIAIDLTLPYEAYTLDGRRVANVDAPGLYIVRQGNLVQKILRK